LEHLLDKHFLLSYYALFFSFEVFIPKGKYKGQKLIKLVKIKMPATTRRTVASVPLNKSVK